MPRLIRAMYIRWVGDSTVTFSTNNKKLMTLHYNGCYLQEYIDKKHEKKDSL